ncbi:MAG: hypothetical protein H7Y05_15125, partial [Steroidobacteraceae bacterium]|nr:hypothetical protein [Deltaproteobacteria bacterium]
MEDLNVTAALPPECGAQELPEELLRHSLLLFADDEQSPEDCAVAIVGETAADDSGSRAAAGESPADAGLPLEQPCHLT